MIQVKQLDGIDWASDLFAFSYGVFHLPQWVEAISDKMHPPFYLNFYRDGKVVGKLSGMEVDGPGRSGHQLYSFSGLIMQEKSVELQRSCLDALKDFAQRKNYSRVFLYAFDDHLMQKVDVKSFRMSELNEYVIGYENGDATDLQLGSNLKRNAKKAQKSGVVVHRTRKPEMLDRMLELIDHTKSVRVEKYGKDYNPMYIHNLNRNGLLHLLENGLGVMFYTEHEGQVDTILFALEHSPKLYFLLMGSNDRAYCLGMPSFLAMHISNYAKVNGFNYYNLGVIPLENEGGEGVRKFKEAQGARVKSGYNYHTGFLKLPYKLINPLLDFRMRKYRVYGDAD